MGLSQLKFFGKLFTSEIMYFENQQLVFKCRQLKNSKKIHSNNAVNIKVTPNGEIHQILHATGIEKLLEIKKLDDFINNTYF